MTQILATLILSDSADTEVICRWADDAGTPLLLSAGVLQVRADQDAAGVLVSANATLASVANGGWASAVLVSSDITAANFESLTSPAVWEFVLTRVADARKLSAVGGPVQWSRGVVR